MKRLAAIFAAVAFIILPEVSFAVNYPSPIGYVNDFANIMPAGVKQSLETKLREYKNKTSIEIAVVTVRSLEGLSVEDYAIGLARKWGVGDKQKNNGVVLLVAPNERKSRIEVGYGLEADLTDSQAGIITRDNMIPYFKQGRMADGIVAGVSGIVLELGDKPYETRFLERKAAQDKKKIEDQKSAQEFKNFLTIVGIIVAIGIVILVIGLVFRSIIRRGNDLKAFYRENAHLLKVCDSMLAEVEKEYPLAKIELQVLKNGNPKEVWIDLEQSLLALPGIIKQAKEHLAEIKALHGRGYRMAEEVNGKIGILSQSVKTKSELLEVIQAKIGEANKAKEDAPALLRSFPKEIEKTRNKLSHSDVSDMTRRLLEEAKAKYDVAKSLSGNQAVNWILVLSVLSAGAALLANAASGASADKAAAEERRRPKPKRRPSPPSSSRKSSDNDVSITPIWSSGPSSPSPSAPSLSLIHI